MRLPTILLFLLLALSGCSSLGGIVGFGKALDQILDSNLPADFVGDARFRHVNPYGSVLIRAGNLHKGPAGWTYSWLVYQRDGWSDGTIVLGTPPPEALVIQ